MDSIAIRTPANGEFTTADRIESGLVVPPTNRGHFAVLGSRVGAGNLFMLTPASGTRVAVAGIDVVVSNAAGVGGGTVVLSMSRDGNSRLGITADAPGNYSPLCATVHVPATPSVSYTVLGLLEGATHYSIPYDGMNALVKVQAVLAAGDTVQVGVRCFPCAAPVACG
jgi:hypothetical protein